MTIDSLANAIHGDVQWLFGATKGMEVARKIDALTGAVDARELFRYNCLHFSRYYNNAFFYFSSSLWRSFSLTDWATLVASIRPRPEPTWGWDGGHYCDISFLLGRLQIDAFEVACNAGLEPDELRKVMVYGDIHLDVLLPQESDATEDDEEPDDYDLVFSSRMGEARSRLLVQSPVLDIANKTAEEVRKQQAHRLGVE